MWFMAVNASRDLMRLFFPQLALYNLAVHIFDAGVASRARLRDIVDVYGRALVGMRQDVVRGVAVGAHRGNDKTALKKSFAVDGL